MGLIHLIFNVYNNFKTRYKTRKLCATFGFLYAHSEHQMMNIPRRKLSDSDAVSVGLVNSIERSEVFSGSNNRSNKIVSLLCVTVRW